MKNYAMKLQELRMKEAELAGRYTEKNPEVQRIRQQIEDLRQMVTRRDPDADSAEQEQARDNRCRSEETLREIAAKLEIEKSRIRRRKSSSIASTRRSRSSRTTYDNVVHAADGGEDLAREQSRMDR